MCVCVCVQGDATACPASCTHIHNCPAFRHQGTTHKTHTHVSVLFTLGHAGTALPPPATPQIRHSHDTRRTASRLARGARIAADVALLVLEACVHTTAFHTSRTQHRQRNRQRHGRFKIHSHPMQLYISGPGPSIWASGTMDGPARREPSCDDSWPPMGTMANSCTPRITHTRTGRVRCTLHTSPSPLPYALNPSLPSPSPLPYHL